MTKLLKVKSRFNGFSKHGLEIDPQERRTKSEFREECDINTIIAKYRRTGLLPQSARAAMARYGDFSQVPTFQEMNDRVLAAHEVFAALPAKVRDAFRNDPGEFIAAADTEEGRKLYRELGLMKPLEEDSVSPAGQAGKGGTEPPKAPSGASKSKSKGGSNPPASASNSTESVDD